MSNVIGFIGQGFIGKHMADDFEERGHTIVRYALEPAYVMNKAKLATCQIIFIAVPTPTTPEGFDLDIVKAALKLVPKQATAVIKSTIVPGSTAALQSEFPDIFVLHSPEFLREQSAREDTSHPERNIVGVPSSTPEYREKAEAVLRLLPPAPYSLITTSENAECVKYIGNTFLYTKLVFMNLAYDFSMGAGADWEVVREAVTADSRIGASHTSPVHASGRGAGGHCFIKDFEAFLRFFEQTAQDANSLALLDSLRRKNNSLLLATHKDLDLLQGVYGDTIPT